MRIPSFWQRCVYYKGFDLKITVNKTLSLLHHTSKLVSTTTSLEVKQKTPPGEGMMQDASRGRGWCEMRLGEGKRRGCAKDIRANKFHSPLLFLILHGEGNEKTGEGIINLYIYCWAESPTYSLLFCFWISFNLFTAFCNNQTVFFYGVLHHVFFGVNV